ncbi:MAG: DUF2461 domain-containing protein [Gemmatimonadaceae bacterium]
MPSAAALTFLGRLARNNDREWFEAHRAEYETSLLAPLRALVDDMDARLAVIAPEFVGDRRRSVFRIHRDVRFSADKRPYKTNAACWLFHRDAGRTRGLHDSVAAAGFYYHLEPGACFIGGGLWMPPAPALRRVRAAIVDDADGEGRFEAILRARAFRREVGKLDEDPGTMLTRLPRGFTPDTPGAGWLRYKSFTATVPLTDEQATAPDLADHFIGSCRTLLPLTRWLNAALGYQPSSRR